MHAALCPLTVFTLENLSYHPFKFMEGVILLVWRFFNYLFKES